MGRTLARIGYLALIEGEDARASALFAESLALSRQLRNKHGVAICLAGLAGVLGAQRTASPSPARN